MCHTQVAAASPTGRGIVCTKIAPKWGTGTPKKALFRSPRTAFILTKLGEQGIYIRGCVLWFLHNYRVAVLRLGGALGVYGGGGHEGTSPPEPLTFWPPHIH